MKTQWVQAGKGGVRPSRSDFETSLNLYCKYTLTLVWMSLLMFVVKLEVRHSRVLKNKSCVKLYCVEVT